MPPCLNHLLRRIESHYFDRELLHVPAHGRNFECCLVHPCCHGKVKYPFRIYMLQQRRVEVVLPECMVEVTNTRGALECLDFNCDLRSPALGCDKLFSTDVN